MALGIRRALPEVAGAVSGVVGVLDGLAWPAGTVGLAAAPALGPLPAGLAAGMGGGTGSGNTYHITVRVDGRNVDDATLAELVAGRIERTIQSVEAGALPPIMTGAAA